MPRSVRFLRMVFVSHSARDTWVARQIAEQIRKCGAKPFLDEADIEVGDDFEQEILEWNRDRSSTGQASRESLPFSSVAFILAQPGGSIDTLASVTDGQLPLVVQPSGQAASKDLEAFLPKFLSPFDT